MSRWPKRPVLDARAVMLAAMSEAGLQRTILTVAAQNGWLAHHDRPSQNSRGGWRTAVAGDPGFPDLVLARDGEVIIVELKSAHGRFEKGQREWIAALGARVVRPADMDALLLRLRMPRRTPCPHIEWQAYGGAPVERTGTGQAWCRRCGQKMRG